MLSWRTFGEKKSEFPQTTCQETLASDLAQVSKLFIFEDSVSFLELPGKDKVRLSGLGLELVQ